MTIAMAANTPVIAWRAMEEGVVLRSSKIFIILHALSVFDGDVSVTDYLAS